MDQAQFDLGLTFDDYLNKMTEARRDGFQASYQAMRLTDEDRQELLGAIQSRLYVLAFSEDWCGDCRINLPVLAKIAETVPQLQLRCWSRDGHPELASAYAVERVPTFVFLNSNWQEIGRFVERPASVAMALESGAEDGRRRTRIAYNQGRFQADTVEEILDMLRS